MFNKLILQPVLKFVVCIKRFSDSSEKFAWKTDWFHKGNLSIFKKALEVGNLEWLVGPQK